MSGSNQASSIKSVPDVFVGCGQMALLMRAHDWHHTPLGSPVFWPQPLKTLVGVMLAAGQPMFVAWGPQRILLYNDAYAALMGERHPHGLGQPFFVVWPDIVDECVPLFERVFAGEPVHMEDIELRPTRHGRPREAHFSFSYTPVRDEAGAVAGLFCVCSEITEQVLSRRREAQEADRQRTLFQQMPGFVAVLSGPHHVFDYVNDAYVAIAGPREFIGRGIRDVFPELDEQGFHELIDQVYATGVTFKASAVPLRLAGETDDRFIDLMYQPLRDAAGEVTGIFVVGHDVTDRVRAEAATEEAGARLRKLNATLETQVIERTAERNLLASIMESTDTLVMAASLDYTILAINSANADEFERIYGVRPRVGDNLLELLADQPEHQAQVRAGWGLGLAGRPINIVEEFGDRERARPHYEIKFRPLHDDHGTLIGCYQFVVDVTQRLRDQISLTETQEALRQSQKMEAIGQLTGGVAHDFNNLLTVIRSSCHLLKRPDLPEDKRRRYVSAISDTVDRAAKLTGQLLAFARRQALEPELFAACASVRALTEMMGTLIGSSVQIAIDLPDQPCFVNADPNQFDTALVNLAVNARDAMDSVGCITVRVRDVDGIPAIRTHKRKTGSFVAISITDTGSGIPSDLVERIFDPFFTTKAIGKGTGLGLSQVFGFAKQSGGEVMVDSMVGEGTTFTLYLPSVPPPEPSVVVQAPEMLVDERGIRVLVVEDNEDVGAFAVQSLTDLGYSTVLATDGLAALAELARGVDRFDVVFSDVVMPGMTGIELGQEIRRLHHDLPVVLTSGYSHVLAQNGTDGFEFLHKPYSVEQLSQMLAKAALWQRRRRLLHQ